MVKKKIVSVNNYTTDKFKLTRNSKNVIKIFSGIYIN